MYYRLKQLDYDGSYEYSQILSIDRPESEKPGFLLSPNPVTNGMLQVSNQSGKAESILFTLFDSAGRVVLQKNHQEQVFSVDTAEITPGDYFAQIITTNSTLVSKVLVE